MYRNNPLANFIYSLSKEEKYELLNKIDIKPDTSRGSAYVNTNRIYDYLVRNGFNTNDRSNLSYDAINQFINNKLNPYYEERVPIEDENYDDEIKKLEAKRDEIDAQIKQLQKLQYEQDYVDEIKQQELNDNYDDMYSKHVNQWVNEQKTTLSDRDIVDKIIKKLYEKPFDT